MADLDFPVTDLPSTSHPEVGETAPDFTRPLVSDEYWEDIALSTVTDTGPTLLVFHPMDGAFPTTYMWNAIGDHDFGDKVTLIGVSVSSPYEHSSLLESRDINARLYADPSAELAELYNISNPLDDMTGITEHRPAIFLLDTKRTIQYVWVATEWPAFPDYDEITAAIAKYT
ncbi:redoxin domain-containing protein [Haloquadratum walsbyi]|jgi:peroxiredoxin|uniref:Peroxiredoxin domain protein n=2 Tax=Haloquadratum walsbyi TaxID=293091 RepID=Q18E40_HALWD|nr:redoxin domain-containing protein [Haloquadratum walsbyi]CAJ53793.1 peroxiredoxin domain protein [Haloquadratum walsbyi DSM 16790]CCC41845.1 peroxiredoxin domain protein [Haloquadratum walsbyi C23]